LIVNPGSPSKFHDERDKLTACPAKGVGRHRALESKSTDRRFLDRF